MIRPILALGVILCIAPITAHGQGGAKALPCFFSADFETGTLPAGWDGGTDVEQQTPDGVGTGEFVPAWTVGTAAQANANGSFPVPDLPAGGLSVMANDDAPPCNCNMANVTLTTPPIDLTDRTNVWLELRMFNSSVVSGDTAYVLVSTNGTDQDTVLTVPPSQHWALLNADLSAYDGAPALWIRFTWSDGGRWASGVAIDDVCLRERLSNDLTVMEVHTNDITGDPFLAGDRTLRYRDIPLEQAAALHPSMVIANNGTNSATGITATVTIEHNGSQVFQESGFSVNDLAPGASAILTASTTWVPDQPGNTVVTMEVSSAEADEDDTDNSGAANMRITGPGWANGYAVMAADEGQAQSAIGGSGTYVAATRMEIVHPGSTIKGISAMITGSSSVGAEIRAMLLDGNLAFVDTSARHSLTQQDLDNAAAGIPIYLALSNPMTVAPGDYFAGMQHLDDDGNVGIWTSGYRPAGADVVMEGIDFLVRYVESTPMVRLHLEDLGVGIDGPVRDAVQQLVIRPNPMTSDGYLELDMARNGSARLRIVDVTGRTSFEKGLGTLPKGHSTIPFTTAGLPPGVYTAILRTDTLVAFGRFQVR